MSHLEQSRLYAIERAYLEPPDPEDTDLAADWYTQEYLAYEQAAEDRILHGGDTNV